MYPLRSLAQGGAVETTPVAPICEYAQSALGRERMFQYASARWGTPVAILRLNYAVELRYGVLVDLGRAVFERRPISLRMPYVNVIWQGDANSWCLRSFAQCQSPPIILNITGPETLSVGEVAAEFGRRFGVEPILVPDAKLLPDKAVGAIACHQISRRQALAPPAPLYRQRHPVRILLEERDPDRPFRMSTSAVVTILGFPRTGSRPHR